MQKKPQDRHLDAPAEANRDKHINFIALERGEKDPADEQSGKLFRNRKSRKNKNKKQGEQ